MVTRFIFSVCFLLLLSKFAFCQEERVIDSLISCTTSKYDTLKIDGFNELSKLYSGTDNGKALQFAFKAYDIAELIKSKRKIAQTYNRIGSVYDIKSQPDSANWYYLEALKLFEALKDKKGLAAVYQNIGVMYYYVDDFDKAIDNYQIALKYRLETQEDGYIAMLYNNIAVVLRRLKKYDESIINYKKALELKQKGRDRQAIAASLQNLSIAYNYKGDLKEAMKYNEQAIEIYKSLNNYKDLATGYASAANIYVSANNLKEASKYCKLSIEYGQKAQAEDLLLNAYVTAFEIDTLLGNHKQAYIDLMKSEEYRSKVYKAEKAKSINKLQILYETEKKDKQISILNIENEAKQKQRNQLFFIIVLITTLLIVSVYFYLRKQKDNNLLVVQKKQIVEKTELLKLQAKEIAKHQSQMNPHFIFNALNSLQGTILNENTDTILEQLNTLSKLMRITLNNSDSEWISLTEELDYLNKYVDFELKRFQVKFTLRSKIANDIDPDNTGIAPMLLQPLVENCIKHANLDKVPDGEIKIEFSRQDVFLCIKVSDNGNGRRYNNAMDYASKGMEIIKSRILELNEKYDIYSDPTFTVIDLKDEINNPKGTLVQVLIPYHELV